MLNDKEKKLLVDIYFFMYFKKRVHKSCAF